MKQYLNLCKEILKSGVEKGDRTGTNTISIFGTQTRYDLNEGFPILTTKKVNFDAVLHELLWFLKGDTNIKYLIKNNVNIWNEWPYENFKKSEHYRNETMEDFIEKIKNDSNDSSFAKKFGNLGPIYGKQWRDFFGVDQIKEVIKEIRENPDSRRLIVSAWNPAEIKDMLLPPCHSLFQFYVENNRLSLQLYQRSADVFLGVPFNISSYSILLQLVAFHLDLKVGELVHTTGDTHIYSNHIEQIKTQLKRKPKPLPKLIIKEKRKNIDEYVFEDFELVDYDHDPAIKGKVAI